MKNLNLLTGTNIACWLVAAIAFMSSRNNTPENVFRMYAAGTKADDLKLVSLLALLVTVCTFLIAIYSVYKSLKITNFTNKINFPLQFLVALIVVGLSRLYLTLSLYFTVIPHGYVPYFLTIISQACAHSFVGVAIFQVDQHSHIFPVPLFVLFLTMSLANMVAFLFFPALTAYVSASFYLVMYYVIFRWIWCLMSDFRNQYSKSEANVLSILCAAFIVPNVFQLFPRLICFLVYKGQFLSMNLTVFSIYLLCTSMVYFVAAMALEWVRLNEDVHGQVGEDVVVEARAGGLWNKLGTEDVTLDDEIIKSVERALATPLDHVTIEAEAATDPVRASLDHVRVGWMNAFSVREDPSCSGREIKGDMKYDFICPALALSGEEAKQKKQARVRFEDEM